MLFHWQLINPFWADAQHWDSWILLAVAMVVVWWNRGAMFSREGAVIEVCAVVLNHSAGLEPADHLVFGAAAD